MTYHHTNRLIHHWPGPFTDPKTKKLRGLSSNEKLVAFLIAQHINLETNHYCLSAETISRYGNGLSRSGIDRAVQNLEAAGVFEITRAGQRSPRDFRLLIECPSDCQAEPSIHYTPQELAARATRPKKPKSDKPELDNVLRLERATQLPHLATQLPHLADELPYLSATNKQTININKENINNEDFLLLVISESLLEIEKNGLLTPEHQELKTALDSKGTQLLDRATELTRPAKNPKAYLKATIEKNPLALLATPELNQGKTQRRYEALRPLFPELVSWDLLHAGASQSNFLERVSKTELSVTAAKLASKAAYNGIDLDGVNSITEAAALVEGHQDPPNPEAETLSVLARSRALLDSYKAP